MTRPDYELANKVRYNGEVAWDVVSECSEVVASKGKKSQRLTVNSSNKADIMKAVLGPTGNLRAPAIKIDGLLVVGFNADVYGEIF